MSTATMDHDHQAFEAAYWGDCCNTFDEEQKHWVYARLMGLEQRHWSLVHPGGRILDIGGGPVSMLLKCDNPDRQTLGTVVDPLSFPDWTVGRYRTHGIDVLCARGEDLDNFPQFIYSEAWIYNCLQHTDDPAGIIRHALRIAPVLRLGEWVDIPPHPGHPQMLTAANLDRWISVHGSGDSKVTELAESGCFGRFYSCVARRSEV